MNNPQIPGRFSLLKVLGRGNFGVVFKAIDLESNTTVALKSVKGELGSHELQNEIKILSRLQDGIGIPKLHYTSPKNDFYTMELLGSCINDKFLKKKSYLSRSNFLIIAQQLLERIEFIHSKSVIHRDLKPHQLVLGGQKNRTVYLIDFGLSKLYKSTNGVHVQYNEQRAFVGTFNYASLNAQLGLMQSRRDDLESYCYILAYLFTGDLPWRTSQSTENDIKRIKASVKPHELFGNNPHLEKIFVYVRSLRYEETPNYIYILSVLNEFKKCLGITSKVISWKSARYLSVSVTSLNIKKVKKNKPKLQIAKKVKKDKINEMSQTIICKEYPEFTYRKNEPILGDLAEARTVDSIVSTVHSCDIF